MPGTWIVAMLSNGRPYPCRGTIVPVPTNGFEAATGFRKNRSSPGGWGRAPYSQYMMLGHRHYAYATWQKHTLQ